MTASAVSSESSRATSTLVNIVAAYLIITAMVGFGFIRF